MMKNLVQLLLAGVIIAYTVQGIPVAASSDYSDHWAKSCIDQMVKDGVMSGFDDGNFKPEEGVTLAQFSKMINRKVGLVCKGSYFFNIPNGMSPNDWFYEDMLIGINAGYIHADSNGKINPNKILTREEVANIIYVAADFDRLYSEYKLFKDDRDIDLKEEVYGVSSRGVIAGYPDGRFMPNNKVKRSEAAKMLSAINIEKKDVVYSENSLRYEKQGGVTIVGGDLKITGNNALVENHVIYGNVYIDTNFSRANIGFRNVHVKGKVFVSAGLDSLQLVNTVVGEVVVKSDKGAVNTTVSGETTIDRFVQGSTGSLQYLTVSKGKGIRVIDVRKDVNYFTELTLKGVDVDSINVMSNDITIKAVGSTVAKELIQAKNAEDTILEVEKDVKIVKVIHPNRLDVYGEGFAGGVEKFSAAASPEKGTDYKVVPEERDTIMPQIGMFTCDAAEKSIGVWFNYSEDCEVHVVLFEGKMSNVDSRALFKGELAKDVKIIQSTPSKRNDVRFVGLESETVYTVSVAARDKAGNYSLVNSWILETGKQLIPDNW